MPAQRFTVTLRSYRIPEVVAKLGVNMRSAIDESAANLRETAVQMAPRDTGALRESIYINNGDQSDYSQRAGSARSLNDAAVIVPEVRPEFVLSLGGNPPDSAYVSVIGSAVNYAIFQELGTRFMRAQPFMIPATEGEAQNLERLMSRIADDV